MPYKANEPRRHKIPKARYRVENWSASDAVLRRRGDLTIWVTPEAVAALQGHEHDDQPRHAGFPQGRLNDNFPGRSPSTRRFLHQRHYNRQRAHSAIGYITPEQAELRSA